ncbi:MAG: hypothetical protein IMW99_06675 [Firmicutes bacterium]|nr:hypothetical protein [Bacillota bacterium]
MMNGNRRENRERKGYRPGDRLAAPAQRAVPAVLILLSMLALVFLAAPALAARPGAQPAAQPQAVLSPSQRAPAPPEATLEIQNQWEMVALDPTPLAPFAAGSLRDWGQGALVLKVRGEMAGWVYAAEMNAQTADRAGPYSRVEFPEAVLSRDLGPAIPAVLEIGKKPFSWGKGFIAQPSSPFRSGQSYWEVSVDLPAWGQVAGAGAAWERWGGAAPLLWARTSLLFATSDLSLGLYGGSGRRAQAAAAYSVDLGKGWELHAELGLQRGSDRLYPTPGGAVFPGQTGLAADRKDDTRVYPRALVGVEFLAPGGILTILETFHQADGYDDAQAAAFWRLSQEPWGAGVVLEQLGERTLLRRDYAALAVTRAAQGDWTWELSHLANLDDGSGVSRAKLAYTGQGDLEPGVELIRFWGTQCSEFGALARWELTASLRFSF